MGHRQSTFNRSPSTWIRDAIHLSKPYWQSNRRNWALAVLSLVIVFNLLTVYMTVLFNKWYNTFYDALQHFDKTGFVDAIYRFTLLAFLYILFQVIAYYFRKILEIRWRQWLTKFYVTDWLDKKAYYKIHFLRQVSDNPDQRISEDISNFIGLILDLSLGLMNSIVTLVSFVVILWRISGALHLNVHGHNFSISGYMVWAALIYAVIGTYFTFKIGRPLIKLDFQQQAYEADFRFGLMRIREHAEHIAFYNGEHPEETNLIRRFNFVVHNFVAMIYRQMKIDVLGIGYAQLAVIFPIVVAAPRYFAKIIQLGDLMQITSAFGRVQDSLSYFINAYSSLANLRAVMDRLYGFQVAITKAQQLHPLPITPTLAHLELKHLNINLPNGQALARNINLHLVGGDRLLIQGQSGIGKTTLLRTLAGLWNFADGEICIQEGLSTFFVAQKPYLPLGRLKDVVCYPKEQSSCDNSQVIEIMTQCDLSHLTEHLYTRTNWERRLSLGEQQKIAFCRILLNNPDIIYLDEATSALDEDAEAILYTLLINTLPQSVIVSVGHRSSVKQWHNKFMEFGSYADYKSATMQ